MSLPSSPSPASSSEDFAAFLDAELQSISSEANSQASAKSDKEESTDIEGSSQDRLLLEAPRKRKRLDTDVLASNKEELDEIEQTSVMKGKTCPPHPGFMWGVCIRCGALKPPSSPSEFGVALRYIHEGLEVTRTEADRIRSNEYEKVLGNKKLYLVLDLDHTLLNSARFAEVPSDEEAYILSVYPFNRNCMLSRGPGGQRAGPLPQNKDRNKEEKPSLYSLENLHMWTKLRPFSHQFIERASTMFEMYLYTMGERIYAQAMAGLLDPSGRFFGSRIISQSDSTCRNIKDLDVMLGAESAVVILDDTEGVWPRHKANLVLMERYHFFSSSCKQFGVSTASLVEAQKDESEDDGTLANTLELLRSVHASFFNEKYTVGQPKDAKGASPRQDVRKILKSIKSKVLAGCKVVFSRVFPTGLPSPENHPFWRLTEELGAVCTNSLDTSITHVVALDKGTDKARWALQHNCHLVHPRWVEAALYTWKRPPEKSYAVDEAQLLSTFSKTVIMEQVDVENASNENDTKAPEVG